jgi:hypothetical protein
VLTAGRGGPGIPTTAVGAPTATAAAPRTHWRLWRAEAWDLSEAARLLQHNITIARSPEVDATRTASTAALLGAIRSPPRLYSGPAAVWVEGHGGVVVVRGRVTQFGDDLDFPPCVDLGLARSPKGKQTSRSSDESTQEYRAMRRQVSTGSCEILIGQGVAAELVTPVTTSTGCGRAPAPGVYG